MNVHYRGNKERIDGRYLGENQSGGYIENFYFDVTIYYISAVSNSFGLKHICIIVYLIRTKLWLGGD